MPVKAFAVLWTTEQFVGGKGQITNPVVEYVSTLDRQDIQVCAFWPSRQIDGLPAHQVVFVIVKTELPIDWSAINALTGVTGIPQYAMSKPISEIPSNVKNAALNALDALNIPKQIFSSCVTWGDVLRTIRGHLKPGADIPEMVKTWIETDNG